jgi:phage shock protein C
MTTPQHTKPARLYRSRGDRVVAGVAGGIARYLGVDPVLVRLAIVALAIVGGSGILAYLIAWVIVPEEPRTGDADYEASRTPTTTASGQTRMVAGIGLVIIGMALLARWVIPSFGDVFWPIVVIASGAGLLIFGARR